MFIHQLDVKSAFLYAKLDEEVWMYPHPEMEVPEGYLCLLLRALYGLKQAPRNWNRHLVDFIVNKMGFKRSELDHCLFILVTKEGVVVLLAVFVDDMLIASTCLATIAHLKRLFKEQFQIDDMGMCQEFLGIRITQSSNCIVLDQQFYATEVIRRFSSFLSARNYNTTPMCSTVRLSKNDSCSVLQQEKVDRFPYREIIGALLYLSVITRFDISYAVGHLSRYMAKPTFAAYQAVCRLLSYVKRTVHLGIRYSGSRLDVHGYSDSDWGTCVDTRKSVSGWVLLMAGAPVSWKSKLQPIVTTSSMEAEYVALYGLVQELVWIRQLLESVGLPRRQAVSVFIDNRSAQALALNPVYHQRSKHIDVKYHWLRQHMADSTFTLQYVSSLANRADIFTKATTGELFHSHARALLYSRE